MRRAPRGRFGLGWLACALLALGWLALSHVKAGPAPDQILFHGTAHDCDGPDFGGHLPRGFLCKGAGTGVGSCSKPGDNRVISYDVQGGPYLPPEGYCHLDWVKLPAGEIQPTPEMLVAASRTIPPASPQDKPQYHFRRIDEMVFVCAYPWGRNGGILHTNTIIFSAKKLMRSRKIIANIAHKITADRPMP